MIRFLLTSPYFVAVGCFAVGSASLSSGTNGGATPPLSACWCSAASFAAGPTSEQHPPTLVVEAYDIHVSAHAASRTLQRRLMARMEWDALLAAGRSGWPSDAPAPNHVARLLVSEHVGPSCSRRNNQNFTTDEDPSTEPPQLPHLATVRVLFAAPELANDHGAAFTDSTDDNKHNPLSDDNPPGKQQQRPLALYSAVVALSLSPPLSVSEGVDHQSESCCEVTPVVARLQRRLLDTTREYWSRAEVPSECTPVGAPVGTSAYGDDGHQGATAATATIPSAAGIASQVLRLASAERAAASCPASPPGVSPTTEAGVIAAIAAVNSTHLGASVSSLNQSMNSTRVFGRGQPHSTVVGQNNPTFGRNASPPPPLWTPKTDLTLTGGGGGSDPSGAAASRGTVELRLHGTRIVAAAGVRNTTGISASVTEGRYRSGGRRAKRRDSHLHHGPCPPSDNDDMGSSSCGSEPDIHDTTEADDDGAPWHCGVAVAVAAHPVHSAVAASATCVIGHAIV
jgi:hypothetical protein